MPRHDPKNAAVKEMVEDNACHSPVKGERKTLVKEM